jgi:hypothetical protein
MSKVIFLLLCLISCCLTQLPRLNTNSTRLPSYSLDLDLPIRERYHQVFTDYKDKIKTIAKMTSYIPSYAVMAKIGIYSVNYQEEDWLEYISVLSEYTGISISESVMLSTTYELACTSVLIRDNNGEIFLGRNLDFLTYFLFAHGMFEVIYYRKGQVVYKGVELAGFRGAINAVKPGKFALALNLRRYHNRAVNFFRIYQGFRTPNYNLMRVLEEAETYEEAVRMLSDTPLTAAVYYTIAGPNEGAIITRNNIGVDSVDKLEGDKWFLVITNTDLDQPEEARRKPTEDRIRDLGRENVNSENLFKIMSQYPTNNLSTIYTSIHRLNGYSDTVLWLP